MQRRTICVLGGSGFLGKEICRLIVAMGHQAVSVSRGGRTSLGAASREQPWIEGVEWVRADILDAAGRVGAWKGALAGCDALIHAVGIGQQENAPSGQNFKRLHRDSVAAAAQAAAQAGVAKFVLISAAQLPPGHPAEYLQSKREGESLLQDIDIPTVILRPSYIHDGSAGLFGALARDGMQPLDLTAESDDPGALKAWVLETPGLRLEKVAMAALRAALQPQTVGILDVAEIEHLGDAMFIQ